MSYSDVVYCCVVGKGDCGAILIRDTAKNTVGIL